jgi:hypothetical protein
MCCCYVLCCDELLAKGFAKASADCVLQTSPASHRLSSSLVLFLMLRFYGNPADCFGRWVCKERKLCSPCNMCYFARTFLLFFQGSVSWLPPAPCVWLCCSKVGARLIAAAVLPCMALRKSAQSRQMYAKCTMYDVEGMQSSHSLSCLLRVGRQRPCWLRKHPKYVCCAACTMSCVLCGFLCGVQCCLCLVPSC